MKFINLLRACVVLACIFSAVMCLNLRLKNELSSNNKQSFSEYLLSELKFNPGSKIDTLVLQERIASNQLYETWSVLRAEETNFRPYYAHIFKYQLANTFPMKPENLTIFCQNIDKLNSGFESSKVPINALTCFNNTYFTYNTPGRAVGNYILFRKAVRSQSMEELCDKNCLQERFCKYHQKELAKSILSVELAKKTSNNDLYAVDILLAKNVLFFGKFGKKQNSNFIFIPLLNFQDLSAFTSEKPSDNLLLLREKQKMVQIGNFLIGLFIGRDVRDVSWRNLTDSYIYLNKEKDSDYVYAEPEPYFGVSKDYINRFQDFRAGKIGSTPDMIAFDKMLEGSYYEFISKLPILDLENKRQFDGYASALKHPFVTYEGLQVTKSDS